MTSTVHSARWAYETRRTAWIAIAVSLAVDLATIIVSSQQTVRRCSDGSSTLWHTFRNDSIPAAFVACIALSCIGRFHRRSPSSRREVGVAYGVTAVALVATLIASWLILDHREIGQCFD